MAKNNYKTEEMNSQTSTDKEEGIKENSKIELIYSTGFSYLQCIYVVVTSLIFQSDYMTVLQKKSCLMVKSKEKQSVINYADIQSVKVIKHKKAAKLFLLLTVVLFLLVQAEENACLLIKRGKTIGG